MLNADEEAACVCDGDGDMCRWKVGRVENVKGAWRTTTLGEGEGEFEEPSLQQLRPHVPVESTEVEDILCGIDKLVCFKRAFIPE